MVRALQIVVLLFLCVACFTENEQLFPFGSDAGDSGVYTLSQEITLNAPFIFYGVKETALYINSNGLLSFRDSVNRVYQLSDTSITLPALGLTTPFLAPLWSSLAISDMAAGEIWYRVSTDAMEMTRAVEVLGDGGVGYTPTLMVVCTWNEVTWVDNSVTNPAMGTNPARNVTFQAVLLSDGLRSFSIFLYGAIHPDANFIIGFNAGDQEVGVVVGMSGPPPTQMQTMSFRTDGLCVTASSESRACSLNSSTTACSGGPPPRALTCTCLSGFTNASGTCQDINECAEATSAICPGGSDCVNLIGSFSCPCRSGFYGNDLTVCIDIDECSVSINDCDANAVCSNTFGGFSCVCSTGYVGGGGTCIAEDDVVTCQEGGANCVCEGEGSGRQCFCDRGYNVTSSDPGVCVDTDECAGGGVACTQECANTDGSFACVCFSGYHLDIDGFSCLETDECETGLHDCDVNAVCTNTDGSFECQCDSEEGYNGNGRVCFREDVCSEGTHGCQVCVPTEGNSFQCLCLPGYVLGSDGVSCEDQDECSAGFDNCHASRSQCTNTEGSFTCLCQDGYYGNGVICEDIDECVNRLDDCGEFNCTNTNGSFICSCPEGFFPPPNQPETCIRGVLPDIDVLPVVRPISQLLYSVGNDACLESTSDVTQLVTLELLCLPLGEIFPPAQTIWTIEVFYISNGSFHSNIDLSQPFVTYNDTYLSFGPISMGSLNQHLFNLEFTCRLNNPLNFHEESTIFRMCAPTECQDGITNDCTSNCSRSGSDYSCSCETGFALQADEASCEEIDECAPDNPTHNCQNSTTCRNTIGSFTCECNTGFRETNSANACEDIDECVEGTDTCSEIPMQLGVCENRLGSFMCDCVEGYEIITNNGRQICIDIDECFTGAHNCTEREDCVNLNSSFTCVCSSGYNRNEDTNLCDDIDECEVMPVCSDNCTNTNGSFHCSCPEGMALDDSKTTCMASCGAVFRSVGSSCEISLALLIPVIIIAFVILILVITIVFVMIFMARRKNWRKHVIVLGNDYLAQSPPTSPLPQGNGIELPELSHIPSDLFISMSELSFETKVLGAGEFGIVHKAKYRLEAVAVKTLKGFHDNTDGFNSLVEEILKMKDFSHSNILTLMGVALDSRRCPCIVMPFMSNGSLVDYLRKDDARAELLWGEKAEPEAMNNATQKLTNYCWQVAKGMEYLSSMKVVHRDLAARNCMMDANHVIKVADFGLSVSMTEDKNYFRADEDSAERLPIKWMAPESLSDRKFSELSDVWAFGVTCWEVFSCGKIPYPTIKPATLFSEIKNGYTLNEEKPENKACPESMHELMHSCWRYEAHQRPSFTVLVQEIVNSLTETSDYLSLSPLRDGQIDTSNVHENSYVSDPTTINGHAEPK